MSKNRYINVQFWEDSYIGALSPDEKYLFLYLMTNSNTNIAGMYEIRLRKIIFDTALSEVQIDEILKKFEADGKIFYVDEYLLMKNFLKHQRLNINSVKGVIKIIDELPLHIKESNGFEIVINYLKSIGVLSNDLNYFNLNSNPKEDIIPQNSKDEDEKLDEVEQEFNKFWDKYDYKKEKAACLKIWKKLEPVDIKNIFRALDPYLDKHKDRQYRKYPAKWLRHRCWEDEVYSKNDVEQTPRIPR